MASRKMAKNPPWNWQIDGSFPNEILDFFVRKVHEIRKDTPIPPFCAFFAFRISRLRSPVLFHILSGSSSSSHRARPLLHNFFTPWSAHPAPGRRVRVRPFGPSAHPRIQAPRRAAEGAETRPFLYYQCTHLLSSCKSMTGKRFPAIVPVHSSFKISSFFSKKPHLPSCVFRKILLYCVHTSVKLSDWGFTIPRFPWYDVPFPGGFPKQSSR